MKCLVLLSAVVALTVATGSDVCEDGWSCVDNALCLPDGTIDTSGGGLVDLRIKAPCVGAGQKCCRDTNYVAPPQDPTDPVVQDPRPGDYHSCFLNEECVPRTDCHGGVIDTTGGGKIDLRIYTPRHCWDTFSSAEGVCCRDPDAPKPVSTCPDLFICSDYDQCDAEGYIQEQTHSGPYFATGQTCYLDPAYPAEVGLCCQYKQIVVPEPCYGGSSCVENDRCNYDGFMSALPLDATQQFAAGQVCLTLAGTHGTCCNPVKVCPVDNRCVPENFCNAQGQLTDGVHFGEPCPNCVKCEVGVNSEETGVCCGPPPPLPPCDGGFICTNNDYCDNSGYVVNAPAASPYAADTVQKCNMADGYSYGICCNAERPPVYCPLESTCTPLDFCIAGILQKDSTNYIDYGSIGATEFHKCDLPKEPQGGVCCKNQQAPPKRCGVSYYANQELKTRFWDPPLDKLEADFGELPWQAIVFYSNYTFKCGAVLIDDQHLLTVAHCVNDHFPYDLKIRIGEWQVNTFDEPLQYQDVDVSAIFVHPQFNVKTVHNNIAIIKLKQPLNWQLNINNICLPTYADVTTKFPPGTRCFASGWGKDSFTGTFQHILKKISLPLVAHDDCQAKLRKTRLRRFFRLHKSYTCAGGEEGIDACVGDGGGPLSCFDEASQQYFLVGLTAWGIGCGQKDVPAAYTDVGFFSSWITEMTTGNPDGGVYSG